MSMTFDPCSILNVPEDATEEQIESAFRKRAFEEHPDHGGTNESMRDVIAARMKLLDRVRSRSRRNSGGPSSGEARWRNGSGHDSRRALRTLTMMEATRCLKIDLFDNAGVNDDVHRDVLECLKTLLQDHCVSQPSRIAVSMIDDALSRIP